MSEPAQLADDNLEAAVDEMIAEHGDARAAVRALVETCRYLEAARNRAIKMVS
jgi:hypothetical protein